MVTSVRTINPKTKRELVNIRFDSKLNVKPRIRICQNELESQEFIEKQYVFAIRTVLTRFAKQQEYIVSRFPAAKGAQIKLNAAAAILKEMEHHQSSPLIVIASAVYWLKPCIYNLAPASTSRFRAHYDEYIYSLVDWCFYYSKKARMKLIERSKISHRPQ